MKTTENYTTTSNLCTVNTQRYNHVLSAPENCFYDAICITQRFSIQTCVKMQKIALQI